MAYKFQVGEATLSGPTKFEEVLDVAGGLKLSGVTAATASLMLIPFCSEILMAQ